MANNQGPVAVTFYGGAPLDANDLNLLQKNIQTTFSQANLHNQTLEGIKSIPSVNSGTITFANIKANTMTVSSDRLTGLSGSEQVVFTPKKPAKSTGKTQITVFLDSSTTPPRAWINSSEAIETCDVDWISVEMKPLA